MLSHASGPVVESLAVIGSAVLLIYAVLQARTTHILEAINESVVAEINFVLSNRAAKAEGGAQQAVV